MSAARTLLVHAFAETPAALPAALRVARNAASELGDDVSVQVVVQGGAVGGLVRDSPMADDVRDLMAVATVSVVACRNSMHRTGVEPDALLDGVGVVPAAVSHLAQAQWSGAAYVRI